MTDLENVVSEMIAAYPGRWRQAVDNPSLRGWFVGRVMARRDLKMMMDRVEIAKLFDKRADAQQVTK